MRTLADIVRGKLRSKGWQQETFAEFLDMSPSYLSEVLNGKKAPSPEHVRDPAKWIDGLGLTGAEADELTEALSVAAAVYYAPRIGPMIERLEAKAAEAEKWKAECDRRITRARQALDLIDQTREPPRVAEPEQHGPEQ